MRHFQNTDSVGTEPKEAAYAATGLNLNKEAWTLIDFLMSDLVKGQMVNCQW